MDLRSRRVWWTPVLVALVVVAFVVIPPLIVLGIVAALGLVAIFGGERARRVARRLLKPF